VAPVGTAWRDHGTESINKLLIGWKQHHCMSTAFNSISAKTPTTCDRCYLPTASEELALENAQDIIHPHGGALKRISQCHPAFPSLHFPLLFPPRQDS